MAEPDPLERLREGARRTLEPGADTSAPGLRDTLFRSLDYAVVDTARSQLVIDRRALLLAMTAVGLEPRHRNSNTAGWFAQWLAAKLPNLDLARLCADARTSETALREAAANGCTAVASESVRSLLRNAVGFAKATVKREKAALRHVFLALIDDPSHKLEIKEFNWSPNAPDIADLRKTLFERIQAGPEPGEDMKAWRQLLRLPPPPPSGGGTGGSTDGTGGSAGGTGTPPPPPAPPTPAFFVSGFAADRTTDHESDPLETEADILAMARLICHEDADPPISIGVFGGWGSGKSTFMEALQWEVANLARPAVKKAQPKEGPRFVSPVVQIRFNAWQFADADLWASLTAEFFDQLRAGGFEGGGKRIHAQLVEKVNEHVRGLGKEAGERRAAQSRADEELRAAQAEHADAVRHKDADVRETLVSGLAEAFEKNRAGLARAGLVDAGSSDQLAQFIAVAKDVRTLSGQVKRIVIMLLRHWPLLLGTALVLAALAWAAVALTGKDLAGAVTAAVGAAAALLPLIRSGLKAIDSVVRETAPFADSIADAEKKGLKAVLDSEVKVRLAREESEALRTASERADRALARYVDPKATANPPRVLRYLLEDDPDTKAFEKDIGLLGRARRLFQALDQIVADNRLKQEKARKPGSRPAGADADAPDPDIPARIILYIDDLDRCTHEQVYKVLQAIHLLLAFELFVVVVAVDVAWIEAALAKSIEFAGADTDDEDSKEAARRQRAIEYLSKIFQLPFWLKPFSGKDDTRYANYVRSLTRAGAASEPAGEADPGSTQDDDTPPAPSPDGGDGDGQPEEEKAGEGGDREDADREGENEAQDDAAPDPDDVARALRTLQLTRDEEDFLASPEVAALAAPDPRGVKRLVNVYKIARSRLSEEDEASILGTDGRAPIFPIIAMCAAVETGQPLDVADSFYGGLKKNEKAAQLGITGIAAIDAATTAAVAKRGGKPISGDEALAVARVVRRYSFNRYN